MNRLISTKYHFYPVPVYISMYFNIKLKKIILIPSIVTRQQLILLSQKNPCNSILFHN